MLRITIVAIFLNSAILYSPCDASDQKENTKTTAVKAEAKWIRAERDRANVKLLRERSEKDRRAKVKKMESTDAAAEAKWVRAERDRSNSERRKARLEKEWHKKDKQSQ